MLATSVMDAMLELSPYGLGLVAVCDEQHVVKGTCTDGDLRRWLAGERRRARTPAKRSHDAQRYYARAQNRAIDAKELLMKRKITAAPVVDENGKLTGAINLQSSTGQGIIPILQSPNASQPVQVGDVGFQRRAGRGCVIILRQRWRIISLEVLRRFAQIAASRQRQAFHEAARVNVTSDKAKMLRLQYHLIPARVALASTTAR